MEKLSVTEAVTHVSRFFSAPADVAATIEQVGLDDDARTRVSRLSVGRRRRLDVGTAIVGRPALLFLDEPATGFDPEACRELWSLVKSLRADGTTVLLTTHYLDLDGAAHLVDDVAVVLGRRIVTRGTPEDLTREASDEPTVSWTEDGPSGPSAPPPPPPSCATSSTGRREPRPGGAQPLARGLLPRPRLPLPHRLSAARRARRTFP